MFVELFIDEVKPPVSPKLMPRNRAHQASAWLLSAALTLGLLIQFQISVSKHAQADGKTNLRPALLLTWLTPTIAPPIQPPKLIAKAPTAMPRLTPHNPQPKEKTAAISAPQAISVTSNPSLEPTPSLDSATTNPITSSTAPSNLRFDRQSIAKAYQDSKTPIEKMAEKSHQSLKAETPSQYDKFQVAANRAAKQDCLRAGGSLLSLLVVAYEAATDHCK